MSWKIRSSALLASGSVNDPITADFKKWGLRAISFKPYTIDELKKGLHDPHTLSLWLNSDYRYETQASSSFQTLDNFCKTRSFPVH